MTSYGAWKIINRRNPHVCDSSTCGQCSRGRNLSDGAPRVARQGQAGGGEQVQAAVFPSLSLWFTGTNSSIRLSSSLNVFQSARIFSADLPSTPGSLMCQ